MMRWSKNHCLTPKAHHISPVPLSRRPSNPFKRFIFRRKIFLFMNHSLLPFQGDCSSTTTHPPRVFIDDDEEEGADPEMEPCPKSLGAIQSQDAMCPSYNTPWGGVKCAETVSNILDHLLLGIDGKGNSHGWMDVHITFNGCGVRCCCLGLLHNRV